MIIFGSILVILSILAFVVLFLVRVFFGGFFKKIEDKLGTSDIGGGIFDFFAGTLYMNVFIFLTLPGIVFILIGYFF